MNLSGIVNGSTRLRGQSGSESLSVILGLFLVLIASGCLSEKVKNRGRLTSYQKFLARKGPQKRLDQRGIGFLKPEVSGEVPPLEVRKDKETGQESVELTINGAVLRTLAQSPEITVTSFDPSIAKQGITQASSQFDLTTFGRYRYDQDDNPQDSVFMGGEKDRRSWEAGVKQEIPTGGQWSLAYSLGRTWDDLTTRTFPTRYEPMVTFQIKQPLLRDAWLAVNLADMDIAKLNYEAAVEGFKNKFESTASELITVYWRLLEARRNLEIQKWLLEKTKETCQRVKDRKRIDATYGQIKQAEASLEVRRASLTRSEKKVEDVQNLLAELLADSQLNLARDIEIVPVSEPSTAAVSLEERKLLEVAFKSNPQVAQARLKREIAERNLEVARHQRLPRLDLVLSTELSGLAKHRREAHSMLDTGDYFSYLAGVTFEYPLGNRAAAAEVEKRKLEVWKAESNLQVQSDKLAAQVKSAVKQIQTTYEEIRLQREAVKASEIHLKTVEDAEKIRQELTPEFLLVKLQAQESLAQAQRAEMRAIVEYNIAQCELARATCTVLDMRQVQGAASRLIEED